MQSTVGPVKSVQMSYNAQGKTTGSATVLFRNKGDAHKAHASCEWVVPRWREESGTGWHCHSQPGAKRTWLTPDNNRMIDNR